MNDKTNLFLASFSSIAPLLQAIDTQKLLPIISAIVLPIFFFCIGKTVDVCVQIYFRRQEARRRSNKENIASNLNSNEDDK